MRKTINQTEKAIRALEKRREEEIRKGNVQGAFAIENRVMALEWVQGIREEI